MTGTPGVRRLTLVTTSAVGGAVLSGCLQWLPFLTHAWSIVLPYLLGLCVCLIGFVTTTELVTDGLCALCAFLGYAAVLIPQYALHASTTGVLLQNLGGGLILTVLSVTFSAALCAAAIWAIFDLLNITLRRS